MLLPCVYSPLPMPVSLDARVAQHVADFVSTIPPICGRHSRSCSPLTLPFLTFPLPVANFWRDAK
jgi:hypothetical protein